MRILICDDDTGFSRQLREILITFFRENSLKLPEIIIYGSGEELLKDPGSKDIVFLDIEVPGYLDDAMRFHVFRYLSKPLEEQRIFRNMKDALALYNSSIVKVSIETKDGIFVVLSNDIVFIEANNHKTIVHTVTDDHKCIRNINYWLEQLQMPCFFQPHRSFIVNLDHVSSFDHSLIYLCNNQYRAYLTRRKYTQFKDAFLLYLESRR